MLMAAATVLSQGAVAAQAAADDVLSYRREVFAYPRAGRPDPFRSLATGDELGVRLEDLVLRGVMLHDDPAQSVAVLSQQGSDRRVRMRVGERVGTIRVLAIRQRSVEVVVEEFGVARRATIELRNGTEKGGS
jgi:hypothetical protein